MKIFKRLCAVIMACTAAACISVGASAAEKTPAEKAKKYTAESPRFDLRDIGAVTSVKTQLPLDTCWSFATMGSLESNMIMQGLADNTIDLSERHLLWFTNGAKITDENDPMYGDEPRTLDTRAYDTAATMYDAIGTLSRWNGVQYEDNAPYFVDKDMEALSEDQRYFSAAHLEEARIYTNDRIEDIQKELIENGACYATYYAADRFYNSKTYSHYGNSKFANHAINIVGWDDNYSKENFKEGCRPKKDGAWIIKNSWGDSWGDNGYFYLSYEDSSLRDITFFIVGDTNNYGNVYQYDGSMGLIYKGISVSVNQEKAVDFTGANVFTAKDDSPISAVGFYTLDKKINYEINIYTGVKDDPSSGKLVHTQKGRVDCLGYHTVKLDKTIPLKEGEKFAVALTIKGYEDYIFDLSSPANGMSYYHIGVPDENSEWLDMYDKYKANPCIKAYSQYIPPVAGNVKLEQDGKNVKVSWDEVEGADIYRVFYRVGNKYKRTASTKKTTATVKGLTDPESVGFVVRARVNGVWSEYSKKDLVYITPDEPDYPLTLTAGDKKVTVKWDAVEGAESYRIYRYVDGKFTTKTTTKTSYTYKKLENGKEYGFLLRVKKDGKWSDYKKSDLVFVTPNK